MVKTSFYYKNLTIISYYNIIQTNVSLHFNNLNSLLRFSQINILKEKRSLNVSDETYKTLKSIFLLVLPVYLQSFINNKT